MDTQDEQSVSSTEDEVISSNESQVDGQAESVDQPTGETPAASPQTPSDPLSLVDNLQLPDEQKKVLRDSILMQSDYTKKTQEIAEVKKQWDQWQPVINYFKENPGVLENLTGPQQDQVAQEEPEIPDDPREFYNSVLSRAKQEAVAEAVALMEQKQARQQDIMGAAAVDPRLSDDNFGRIIASLVEADPDVKAGRKSFTEATKSAVAFYDSYASNMESKIRSDITQKAQSKTMVTPMRSSPLSTEKSAPATMQEAYKQTLDELGG